MSGGDGKEVCTFCGHVEVECTVNMTITRRRLFGSTRINLAFNVCEECLIYIHDIEWVEIVNTGVDTVEKIKEYVVSEKEKEAKLLKGKKWRAKID